MVEHCLTEFPRWTVERQNLKKTRDQILGNDYDIMKIMELPKRGRSLIKYRPQ